jgi:hypothetical protein
MQSWPALFGKPTLLTAQRKNTMRAITDQDRADGFVVQILVYTFPAKSKGNKVTLQGWVPISQEEYDNPQTADLTPERQGWWQNLVKHVGPGQVYRMIYNPETQTVRATIEYLGLFDHPERLAAWRRERDAFDQTQQETKLAEKDRKDDPLNENFAALREEYQQRHGAARRAFLVRLIYEITK